MDAGHVEELVEEPAEVVQVQRKTHRRSGTLAALHKPLSLTEFAALVAVIAVGAAVIVSILRGTPEFPHAKKVGCFSSDALFSADKWAPTHSDSTVGANVALGLEHARISTKRYFAVAREEEGGQAFTFDRLLGPADASGPGCDRPCDDFPSFSCGCADSGCIESVDEKENVRR
jgi:hypothetical protein